MICLLALWIGLAAFLSQTSHVTSHGSLIQPAQRSGAWRFGFQNPENYNDNQLFCGGKEVQWNSENDGKCGVCGDPYNATVKPNEDVDGEYVRNGVITGSYVRGSVMTTKVNLTAYHKGWFEFKLCPLETFTTKVTQACLNQTLLPISGSNIYRIDLESYKKGDGSEVYEIDLQLPANITCDRCVLQWRYNTGNSWGCEPGKCCVGCGKQENFVNCADIRISDGGFGTTPSTKSSSSASQSATMSALTSSLSATTSSTTRSSTTLLSSSTTETTTTTTKTTSLPKTTGSASSTSATQSGTRTTSGGVLCSSNRRCSAVAPFDSVPGMANWCCLNCEKGFCPTSHCACSVFDS